MKKLLSIILTLAIMSSVAISVSAAEITPRTPQGDSVSSAAATTFQLNAYTWGTPTSGTPVKAYENVSGDNSQRWQINDRYIRSATNTSLVVTKSGSGTILTWYGADDYNSKITPYNNGQGYSGYILWSYEQANNPVSTMLQLDGYYNGANISFSPANGTNTQRWYTGMYY